ncbi:MAG: hypothetical protein L0287_32205, partial [Anaerolineae bacterium]|nr:hypothetical protein [Anaerolineae bacterium]
MYMRVQRLMHLSLVALLLNSGLVQPVLACDVCGLSFNASRSGGTSAEGTMVTTPTANTLGKGHASAGFLFEHQRFNTIPARDAHTLHHRGHDVHGKNHEEFYNLTLGYGVWDDVDVYLAAPIVSKTSIEVHEHDAVGQN